MKATLIPILLLSFISLLYIIVGSDSSYFSSIFLLPLCLFMTSLLFNKIHLNYANSTVFKLFAIQLGIRYSILPALLSSNYELQTIYNFNTAIIIMLLELFTCHIVLFLLQGKQKYSYLNKITYIEPLKQIHLIVIFLVFLLLYIYSTGAFNTINPIWSLNDYVETHITNNEERISSGYGALVFILFRALLALVAISIIARSNNIKNSYKKWMYLLVIVISNLYIIGTSRFSIILFSLPLLFLVADLLDKKDSRRIISIATIAIVVVLSIASVAKFSRYGNNADLSNILSATSLNAYFAGPLLISSGLDAGSDIKGYESVLFLFNDTLNNIPLLSHFTSNEFKTNIIFNESIYGHRDYSDQIVPLSISGYFHFGILGVMLYSSMLLALALWFERNAYKEPNIGFKYLYISLSISLSLIFMVNISSMYATIVRNYLFLFLPLLLISYSARLRINKTI